jgi:hypothetical protein
MEDEYSPQPIAAQFVVIHGRDFYMKVNALEQRAGDVRL